MNVKITYDEIQDLVKTTANQKVVLKAIDDKTLEVTYTISVKIPIIGLIEKDVTVNVEPKQIKGLDLTVGYSLTWGLDFLVGTIKVLAKKFIDILTWTENDNEIIIHIDKILEKSGADKIDEYMNYIHNPIMLIEKDGLNLSFDLKI